MLPFRRKVVAPATKGGAAEGSIYNSPLNQPALWAELVRFLHRNRKSGSYASIACPLSEHLTA